MKIRKWLNFGLENVLDADIASFFDTIPHNRLMDCVKQRIVDRGVLRLIRAWLRAGILENGEVKPTEMGTPQGGVISPLLANIYLDQLDKAFEKLGLCRKGPNEARLVRYADDVVILSVKPVWTIRRKVHAILQELGLSLKMEKTRVVKADEGFDFLGFRCARKYSEQHGKRITLISPTSKAQQRAREAIRARVGPHTLHVKPAEVVESLNQFLRGWTNYYKHTNARKVFCKVQDYCNWKVRRYLQRRRARKGAGWKRYTNRFMHEVLKLENIATKRLERVWS